MEHRTPYSASDSPLVDFDAVCQKVRAAIEPARAHAISLHDENGDVLWLSESSMGPDEHNAVREALEAFHTVNGPSVLAYDLGDARSAMLLRAVNVRRALVGAIMVIMDTRAIKQDDSGGVTMMTPKLQRALADFAIMRPDVAPVSNLTPAWPDAPAASPASPAAGASRASPAPAAPVASRTSAAAAPRPATLMSVKANSAKTAPSGRPAPAPVVAGRKSPAAPAPIAPSAALMSFKSPSSRAASPGHATPTRPAAPAPSAAAQRTAAPAASAPRPAPVAPPASARRTPPAPSATAPRAAPTAASAAHSAPAAHAAPAARPAVDAPPAPVSSAVESLDFALPPEFESSPPAMANASSSPWPPWKKPETAESSQTSSEASPDDIFELSLEDSEPVPAMKARAEPEEPEPEPVAAPEALSPPERRATEKRARDKRTPEPVPPEVDRLHAALRKSPIFLHVQRLVPLAKGSQLKRYEVLLRSKSEDAPNSAPQAMLKTAVDSGLGSMIDRRVVTELIGWLVHHPDVWQNNAVMFSVNLTATALHDEHFIKFVGLCLAKSSLPTAMIAFEVDVGTATKLSGRIAEVAAALHRLGCPIVLDDFALRTECFELLRLPGVRYVKLDSEITAKMRTDKVSQAAITAIVQMARVLGMHTAAKRTETPADQEWLTALGVDFIQSHALSPPAAIDTLSKGSKTKS